MSSLNLRRLGRVAGVDTAASVEDKLARESDVTVSTTNITENAEYKGFFIYVVSAIALAGWIGWTILPDKFLNEYLSIYYYPDKYWSLAIPTYSLMLMLFIYIALALYNTEVLTLPLNDVRNFVDEFTVFPNEQGENLLDYIHRAPSGVWDLPITLVNEVLYDDEDDE